MSESRQSIRPVIVGTIGLYSLAFFLIDHNFRVSFVPDDPEVARSVITSISVGSPLRRFAAFLLVFSGVVFFLKARRPDFKSHQGPLYLVALYLAWAWLSYFWADDPGLVLRRVISFSALLFASLALSRTLSRYDFLLIVFGVSLVFLVIGIATEGILGTFNPGAAYYRFMGTVHPESQGFNCAILVLSAVAISDGKRRFGFLFFRMIAAVAFIFLFLTKSRGPFAGLVVACVAYFVLSRRRLSTVKMFYLVLFVICFFVLVIGWPNLMTALLMGRQEDTATLTGRVPLWVECWSFVEQRPWAGYGFNSFWTEARTIEFVDSQGWISFSGHSIYLDTALNLGFVGLLLLLGLLLTALRMSWRRGAEDPDYGTSFLAGLLVLMCVDGVLSSHVILGGFVTFVLYSVILILFLSEPAHRANSGTIHPSH